MIRRVNGLAILLQRDTIASEERDVELQRQRLRRQGAARKRWPSKCALPTVHRTECCRAKPVPNILFRARMNTALCRSGGGAFAGDGTFSLPLGRADGEVFVAATAVVVLTTGSAGVVAGTKARPLDASAHPFIVELHS